MRLILKQKPLKYEETNDSSNVDSTKRSIGHPTDKMFTIFQNKHNLFKHI